MQKQRQTTSNKQTPQIGTVSQLSISQCDHPVYPEKKGVWRLNIDFDIETHGFPFEFGGLFTTYHWVMFKVTAMALVLPKPGPSTVAQRQGCNAKSYVSPRELIQFIPYVYAMIPKASKFIE